MTTARRPSLRSTLSARRPLLLLFSVAIALTLWMAGCDSGGGSNPPPGDEVAATFEVTVQSIDESYPYSDQNQVEVAYAIDGEVGKVLTLERGKTYEFEMGSGVSPNHPFYIGTTAEGQGGDEFNSGVSEQKVMTGTVTFSVPDGAPDSLFYLCDNHVYMGGKMNISSSGGSSSTSSGDDGGNGDY